MLHGKFDGVGNTVDVVVNDALLLAKICDDGGGDVEAPIVESTEPGSL